MAGFLFANGRLAQVERLLGGVLLSDVTADRIKSYIRQRQIDGASGRTINMELGELSRAMGQPWRVLWPKVRKLEERKDVGRSLSPEEQEKLLAGLLALMGHMSRAMLERYSHIRMAAKREAMAGVTLAKVKQELAGVPVKVPVVAALAVLQ